MATAALSHVAGSGSLCASPVSGGGSNAVWRWRYPMHSEASPGNNAYTNGACIATSGETQATACIGQGGCVTCDGAAEDRTGAAGVGEQGDVRRGACGGAEGAGAGKRGIAGGEGRVNHCASSATAAPACTIGSTQERTHVADGSVPLGSDAIAPFLEQQRHTNPHRRRQQQQQQQRQMLMPSSSELGSSEHYPVEPNERTQAADSAAHAMRTARPASATWDPEQLSLCGRYGCWPHRFGSGYAAASGAGFSDVTGVCSTSDDQQQQLPPAWRSRRVSELLAVQEELKQELQEAKRTLMLPDSSWSYDLLVANNTAQALDLSYIEALEKETLILQRRVDACKSRIMVVTSLP